jgi:hypothetical protein
MGACHFQPRQRRHIALRVAMPNTYTQLRFHVVFSTKNRQRTLPDGHRELLYRYIWRLIEYIKGQAEHHRAESLLDEYRRLLRENGVVFDERYLA